MPVGMRRKKLIGALLASLAGGLVLVSVFRAPREPVYQGKPLSLWLRTYGPSSRFGRGSHPWNEADAAVRCMGTNTIPYLLQMLRASDSRWKLRVASWAQRQHIIRVRFTPASARNVEASRAFIALGQTARSAVPELMKIYAERRSIASQVAVEEALTWIGPSAKPALPLLLAAATNANATVRASALWALGALHAEPQRCVPVLIRGLGDSNEWTALSAAHSLGQFGPEAQSAIPSLVAVTNLSRGFGGARIQLPLEARRALEAIAPAETPPFSDPPWLR
jgi:hypothetical protein